jgi:sulfonate transport system permease protein
VRLLAALPSFFASLRIAAPLAMTGAMLAEWLATGRHLGYTMLSVSTTSDYDGLWSRVAIATTLTIAIHNLIGALKRFTLHRFGAAVSR